MKRSDIPIADYAVIGNGQTAALVSRDGCIDWCCWPRFDSPAIFCRIVDSERGGYFHVAPVDQHESSRCYIADTNILATSFTTKDGQCRLIDLMPAPEGGAESRVFPHRILRKIECAKGHCELQFECFPTFDFGRAAAEWTLASEGAIARAGDAALVLVAPGPLQVNERKVSGRVTLAEGESCWLILNHVPAAHVAQALRFAQEDAEREHRRTLNYWQQWADQCDYDGPYRKLVLRSALVLKLLVFQPTGGLIASPTTSLPEKLGGELNWDYRYAWLRDSGMVLDALMQLGYHDESRRFIEWVQELKWDEGHLRIMYTVDGSALPPEQTLDHLRGYCGSRPVRVGNAAARQRQLDVYGHVLDAVVLCYEQIPRPVEPELWSLLKRLAGAASSCWQETGQGPWESRGEWLHFTYSKLFCWVALDRVLRFAERRGLEGNLDLWRKEREAIRHEILKRGYNRKLGAFVHTLDGDHVDPSLLNIPIVGFLPGTDPRVLGTIDRITNELVRHGLVYRSRDSDGQPRDEASFALCSFWLVSALTLAGRRAAARELFEHVCSFANDVGLLAEEIEPRTGELRGNFPQGFAHLGLIRAAIHLADAADD